MEAGRPVGSLGPETGAELLETRTGVLVEVKESG